MRCNNCGWENPDGVQVCVKCGSPLLGAAEVNSRNVSNSASETEVSNLHSTVREGVALGYEQPIDDRPAKPKQPKSMTDAEMGSQTCSQCGYPLGTGMTTCPQCGTPILGHKRVAGEHLCASCGQEIPAGAAYCPYCGTPAIKTTVTGTINPWSRPKDNAFFTLKPLSWDGEGVEYERTTHSGERIVLNRANTDANNNSITSKEQAVLTKEEGRWYIENLSAQHTTLLRVDRKIELTDGDMIVLGNRMFEFKTK